MKLSDLSLVKYEAMTRAAVAAAPAPAPFAITKRLKLLTADGQSATRLEQEAVLGRDDRVEASFFDRCLLARSCVGRIRVRGNRRQGWATGFLVSPGLVLTNHHVFSDEGAVGSSRIAFDYWVDIRGSRPSDPDEYEFRPDLFFVSSPDLDYALVQVAEKSAGGHYIAERQYLRLIPESGKAKRDEFVTILQHPEGEPLQVAVRENKVTRAEDSEPYIWYEADTAHGSSGAPVFNDQFQVVALHASGRIERDAQGRFKLANGKWVTSVEGLDETDVKWETNVGYRASRISEELLAQTKKLLPARASEIEAAMRGGDVMSSAIKSDVGTKQPNPARSFQEELMPDQRDSRRVDGASAHCTGVVIPLQLRVSIELHQGQLANQELSSSPQTAAPSKRLESEGWEMRMPVIYDDLELRPGFNPNFLDAGSPVPMPEPTASGQKKLAPLLDGSGTELKYMHFSVWIHKDRRLALCTAANVDWTARKKVVDGQKTTRDSLAGWPGQDFSELWAAEERIATEQQLPDEFYTEDRKAFDKGHIVRRDDVCWGDTFEEIQMANGDTFHVSNCSPQLKSFNQGSYGEDNWGDLEAAIEKITKEQQEKACIFAGPVFGAADRWFHGTDGNGNVRVQIPSKYWKIVVVKSDQGFDAFGFVLEQDVRAVTEKEFYVTEEWTAAWKPLGEIQKLMRGWLNLTPLIAYDRFA